MPPRALSSCQSVSHFTNKLEAASIPTGSRHTQSVSSRLPPLRYVLFLGCQDGARQSSRARSSTVESPVPRRYSNDINVYIRIAHDGGLSAPASYAVSVASPGMRAWSGTVVGAASYRGAIDDPSEIDSVARAALAFAADDGYDVSSADSDDSGYTVTRARSVRV